MPATNTDPRRNPFGQLSTLHAETCSKMELTYAEGLFVDFLRELVTTETDPDTNADFATWAYLKCEVGAKLQGKRALDIDRDGDPVAFLAIDAVALYIRQQRIKHGAK